MISERTLVNRKHFNNVSNSHEYATSARFRWYNYKEGFSGQIVDEAVEMLTLGNDDYILDPFNGNGTVTLTAASRNIKAIGIEVNPFSAFMSKTKMSDINSNDFESNFTNILASCVEGAKSTLLSFSTFSEFSGKDKWLFNSEVLNTFEGGWRRANQLLNGERDLYHLALIAAALENCNAVKDGKCLKYRENWQKRHFNKQSFISSLSNRLAMMSEDLRGTKIKQKAIIINGDAREEIQKLPQKFKLCITSPPYLNSFDYTDIYRPELFLGSFVKDNIELNRLRHKTLRSHVEIKLPQPTCNDFGQIYRTVTSNLNKSAYLWDKQIPIMVQSYFEDMQDVLRQLKEKALLNAELWLVVANSIYAGSEIPVDLILAEIGTRLGWNLIKIEVLRNIQRRQTKYNGSIKSIRESLIVFKNIG